MDFDIKMFGGLMIDTGSRSASYTATKIFRLISPSSRWDSGFPGESVYHKYTITRLSEI